MHHADTYRERRARAVETARGRDPQAIVELLDLPDASLRDYAAGMIRRQRISSAVPSICARVLDEPDREARTSMTLALAQFGAPESTAVLRTLLHDDDKAVRRLALRGLSVMGDKRVVGAAVEMYATAASSSFDKQEALDALARLQTDEARVELGKLLAAQRGWWWRRRIRRALKGAPVRRHS